MSTGYARTPQDVLKLLDDEVAQQGLTTAPAPTASMAAVAFDMFRTLHESRVQHALAAGTLDLGIENVKADRIEKLQAQPVYTHPETGAVTEYAKFHVADRQYPMSWGDLQDATYGSNPTRTSRRGPLKYVQNRKSGNVWAVFPAPDDPISGETRYRLVRPLTHDMKLQTDVDERDPDYRTFDDLSVSDAQDLWETDLRGLPDFKERELHLITGALLPIWNRLPQTDVKVQRLLTTDTHEEFLGRVIPPANIDQVLRNLGVSADAQVAKTYTPADLMDGLMKGTLTRVELSADNWAIKKSFVSGENRLEITGPDFSDDNLLRGSGVIIEDIQHKRRYFIPTGDDGLGVLEQVVKDNPVAQVRRKLGGQSSVWGQDALGHRTASGGLSDEAHQDALRIVRGNPRVFAKTRVVYVEAVKHPNAAEYGNLLATGQEDGSRPAEKVEIAGYYQHNADAGWDEISIHLVHDQETGELTWPSALTLYHEIGHELLVAIRAHERRGIQPFMALGQAINQWYDRLTHPGKMTLGEEFADHFALEMFGEPTDFHADMPQLLRQAVQGHLPWDARTTDWMESERSEMSVPNTLDAKTKASLDILGRSIYANGQRGFKGWASHMRGRAGKLIEGHLRDTWDRLGDFRKTIDAHLSEAERINTGPTVEETKAAVKNLTDRPWDDPTHTLTAVELYKMSLEYEARGSKEGFREGQLAGFAEGRAEGKEVGQRIGERAGAVRGRNEHVAALKELTEFVSEHLPLAERGRILRTLAAIQTDRDLEKAYQAVQRIYDAWDKRQAISELKEVLKGTRINKLRPEFQAAALGILEDVASRGVTQRTIDAMNRILQHAELDPSILEETIDGNPNPKYNPVFAGIYRNAQAVLARSKQTDIHKMKASEVRAITSALLSIISQNALKNALIIKGRRRSLDTGAADAAHQATLRGKDRFQPAIDQPNYKKDRNAVRLSLVESQMRPETMALWVSTHEGSVAHEVLYQDLEEGVRQEYEITQAAEDFARPILAKHGLDDLTRLHQFSARVNRNAGPVDKSRLMKRKVKLYDVALPTAYYAKLGMRVGTVKLDADTICDLLATADDPHAMKHLSKRESGGIVWSWATRESAIVLTYDDIQTVREKFPNLLKFVQSMKAWMATTGYKLTNEVFFETNFYNMPFNARYWPVTRSFKHFMALERDPMEYISTMNLQNQGFLKERTGGSQPMVIGSFLEKWMVHVHKVARYNALTRRVANAQRLLGHPTFNQAISRNFGEAYLRAFSQYVDYVAGTMQPRDPTAIAKAILWIRPKVYKAQLGFKPFTMFMQTCAYPLAKLEMRAKDWAVGQGVMLAMMPGTHLSPVAKRMHAEMVAHKPGKDRAPVPGPLILADAIMAALAIHAPTAGQRATFKIIADACTSGRLGDKDQAAEKAVLAAHNIQQDPANQNKAGCFVEWFKRHVEKHGLKWADLEGAKHDETPALDGRRPGGVGLPAH